MKTSPSRKTALGMEAASFLVRGLRLSKPELKDTAYSPVNAQKNNFYLIFHSVNKRQDVWEYKFDAETSSA
jgi:hypothetical protein